MKYTTFTSKEERKDFINTFKKKGYKLSLPKNYMVKSPFPIGIDYENRKIDCLTAASYAAIAKTKGLIVDKELLLKLLDE